ncbi:glycosyltransferase family 2 protein [Alicyclobacillus sp. SO9]|uniref:glycosyltransferase family 2 protein n=1 Tax=Alicyclobacillus sp. SO9 TaxID=2665646 RepID=UPI0018E7DCE7|nr:glycosyltransferase family 2 protein [Alicyclobacillus sp. SO9]QQE77887.1 glycosyltransferase family 2 protein [Alicyclobacillus sp. SO9]
MFAVVLHVIQYVLLFFWGYWLFIGLFGFGKAKKMPDSAPATRFALFVPAHNEERVVYNLLDNLNHLDYPKHMYDVFLIADNCTDDTALIGHKANVHVLEHFSEKDEPKGKPYAIKYAIDELGDRLMQDYDAIAIFDADNLVSLNYLQTMNNHVVRGDQLIQCYLDSKNPNDNWITLSYATSYYYMNRSWQLAKSRLRLGNALGGTGFCLTTELLQKIGWTARSLTEDLEFTMQSLLHGDYAKWNHFARVYDEKPEGFVASAIQRLRWARGHWDVCFHYVGPLLLRSFLRFDIRAFDGAMYLLNPGKIVLGSLTSLLILTKWLINVHAINLHIKAVHHILPIWIWIGALSFNLAYISFGVILDSGRRINLVKAIASVFVFNYTYIPLFIWGFFTARNKTWKRTDHTRDILINDVHQLDGVIPSSAENNPEHTEIHQRTPSSQAPNPE